MESRATPVGPGIEGLLTGKRFLVEHEDGTAHLVIAVSDREVAQMRRVGLIPCSAFSRPSPGGDAGSHRSPARLRLLG